MNYETTNSSPFYPTVTDRGGDNDKSLSLLSLVGNRLRLMVTSQWGGNGSLAALTTSPGGVRHPGAPFPLLYQIFIY